MKLTIQIDMDNAAFAEDCNGAECARILRKLSNELGGSVLAPGQEVRLRDVNGNLVGEARVTR